MVFVLLKDVCCTMEIINMLKVGSNSQGECLSNTYGLTTLVKKVLQSEGLILICEGCRQPITPSEQIKHKEAT